jgi:hypothetical protein
MKDRKEHLGLHFKPDPNDGTPAYPRTYKYWEHWEDKYDDLTDESQLVIEAAYQFLMECEHNMSSKELLVGHSAAYDRDVRDHNTALFWVGELVRDTVGHLEQKGQ